MTDYQTVEQAAAAQQAAVNMSTRNWQSFRTILEMAILAGVLWLMASITTQREATAEIKAQIGAMRDGMSALQLQLSGLPQLNQSMARIEVKLDEHERRISEIEAHRK